MNHLEFILSAFKISENTGRTAAKFVANPIIMGAIEGLYHSPSLEKKIGNIDAMDKFVHWLYLNPRVFYRTIRLAQRRERNNEHYTFRFQRGQRHYAESYRGHDLSSP